MRIRPVGMAPAGFLICPGFLYMVSYLQAVIRFMRMHLSVLQDSPFTDQGSVVDVFKDDLSVWAEIRKTIEQVNANAGVA